MMKAYDADYVQGLERRLKEVEYELHVWKMNGVMLDLEARLALYTRDMERVRDKMDEDARRAAERIDELMIEAGL